MNWFTTRMQIAASVVTPAGRTTLRQILSSKRQPDTSAEATHWAAKRAVSQRGIFAALDPELWAEACAYELALRREAEHSWGAQISSLGGGGDVKTLYFLARFRQPKIVVESGVAAGWSSRALLDAIVANGKGVLYSSDLPYVWRIEGHFPFAPMVPNGLRDKWVVNTSGDRKSLPKLHSRIERIDLFHYDSDKTYAGRQFAISCLSSMFHDGTVLVMDDIQDNIFFRDYCEKRCLDPLVFHHQGKFLGVAGPNFSL
jgi:predicted O-methyltransferase YrrM